MSSIAAVQSIRPSTYDAAPVNYDDATSVLPLVPPGRPDEDLTVDELGARIVGLAGRISAATCRWLLLVARFDAAEGCARLGLPSTARWLSHTCGLSHRTAVEHVRVARGVQGFPLLARRMATGRLSYSHVRAITRLARDGEHELVADLVEIAEHGSVGQLESVVRGLRTVDDNRATEGDRPEAEPSERGEYLSQSWGSDSRWRIHSRLDPENGSLVRSALAAVSRSEPDGRPLTAAEALVRMAEIALATLNDSEQAPRLLRAEERAAIVVHLDATAVAAVDSRKSADDEWRTAATDDPATNDPATNDPATNDPATNSSGADARTRSFSPRSAERGDCAGHDGDTAADGHTGSFRFSRASGRPLARIADGRGLPDRVVTRLLCSGRIRTVIRGTRPADLWNLGRSHRVVTDRLFRTLLLRDGGCAHPGCGSRHGLEAHHVQHWIDGGPTHPDNLVLLCRRHHHAHHDGAFTMVRAGPAFEFRRTDGRLLPVTIDPSAVMSTTGAVEDAHPDVAADAATTHWTGDRVEHGYAVAVLAHRRQHQNRCA